MFNRSVYIAPSRPIAGAVPAASDAMGQSMSKTERMVLDARAGRWEAVLADLAAGYSPTAVDGTGSTVLHWAAMAAPAPVLEVVLQHCPTPAAAVINTCNMNGFSPVALAASRASPASLALLLAHGADLNSRGDFEEPVLVTLVSSDRRDDGDGCECLALALAQAHLDLDAAMYRGMTPEEWATLNDRPNMASMVAQERVHRSRWSRARCAWLVAVWRGGQHRHHSNRPVIATPPPPP